MKTQCVDIRKSLLDYREDRLARSDKTAVEQHLHYCEDCILRWALLRARRDEKLCRV